MSLWTRYLAGDAGRWAFRHERLRLRDGRTLGQALERDPWQRELWDLVDAPELRVGMIVGTRGLGKTELAGAVAIERMVLRTDFRVFAIANDADQARLIHEAAAGFVTRDKALAAICNVQRNRIECQASGSRLEVLTSDAISSYGLGSKPTLFVFDELWGLTDRALLDAVLSALPKAPGSQLLVTTNAGFFDTPAWELWKLCRDGGDSAFRGWDSFERGVWPSWMPIEERERQRRLLPASVFERFFENRWTSGSGEFLSREDVEACIDEDLEPHALRFSPAHRHYLGIDLGLKHDRSAIVVLHKERERAVVDHVATWYGTPERPVSLEDVHAYLAMLGRRIPRLKRAYADPWQGSLLIERARRGGMRTLEEFPFTTANVQLLSQSLWNAFRSDAIRIPPYGPLIDELVGAKLVQRRYGWRIDHQAGGFSDHLMALGLALVASIGESGEVVIDDTRWQEMLEAYKARVADWRPFGFGKRHGLTLVGGPKDLEAEIRVAQILRKLDRISGQEYAALRQHIAERVHRTPGGLRSVGLDDGGWLDRELGSLESFVLGREREDARVA